MKDYLKILVVLLTVSVFTACSDDDDALDSEKPTIMLNEPENGEEFEIGGELHFDIELADNQGLASYKVEVHSNSDGHTHSVVKQQEETPWSYDQTFQITGNPLTYDAHEHIDIPEGIAEGEYHLGIIVVDAAGNQEEAFVEIMLGHHGDDHDDHDHDHDH
ncbi:DUF4625 domain-containing protein [Gramella sp. GC03-9]|uniref:DUF4625 domain-containing protein n=1 Tax=Christiangramia oceanisediminis TaxID=2920386 RepID=A0A9X2I7C1_9FLAO|nr:DUF4625 domain-containing protein [Gramella oceanisediminis]MCP9198846.1 DUF4625 domain-containing protein [Gramella oceanisediminis]